jgi:spore maturation protein CgeB
MPVRGFQRNYPGLDSTRYPGAVPDLNEILEDADLVLVHEWNPPGLIRSLGSHRRAHGGYRLYFHDTHHRAVSAPDEMAGYDLSGFDGALVFGRVLRQVYLENGWAGQVWVWHEAADTRLFQPPPEWDETAWEKRPGDLVWVGNWGDGERTEQLREFLADPCKRLGLTARVYGVRYPRAALSELSRAGIRYRGWVPNYRVPALFGSHRATVHIPRSQYVTDLPGIPTIRVFEALACGIPLVVSPWEDCENLFTPGEDFLVAENGGEMAGHLRRVLGDPEFAMSMARRGRRTILERHTCAHRVDQLLDLVSRPGREISRTTAGEAS